IPALCGRAQRPTHPIFSVDAPASTDIYTLSLHDALPIYRQRGSCVFQSRRAGRVLLLGVLLHLLLWLGPLEHRCAVVQEPCTGRSEEHTSELQSLAYLVCRLLLEKKNSYSKIVFSSP